MSLKGVQNIAYTMSQEEEEAWSAQNYEVRH